MAGGTYKVEMRIYCYGSSNGIWVDIPGATIQVARHSSGWVRANDLDEGEYWHWDVIHSSEADDTEVEWTMPAGTYTLIHCSREDGFLVDAIVITSVD